MESVSLMLMAVGAVIIGAVLVLRVGLRNRRIEESPVSPREIEEDRVEEPDLDPLFAIDKQEEVPQSTFEKLGKIIADQGEAQVRAPDPAPAQSAALRSAAREAPRASFGKRRPPRTADDPQRVVVLNVMAGADRGFSGAAVRDAVEGAGFEYGEWQIFHYYAHADGDAPPLFSLTNMIKPGSFDLQQMAALNTAGLSLFMVPACEEDDLAAFDTMLGTARQLAAELGGEVRDARRSVLTRQAIGRIREQLNEWRCKARVAQH